MTNRTKSILSCFVFLLIALISAIVEIYTRHNTNYDKSCTYACFVIFFVSIVGFLSAKSELYHNDQLNKKKNNNA
jgi:hypothetical protein